ncbi:hypothetical protein EGW08_004931 [Elysia chlorotica]|uniref:Uncharacterized protein n=1 Tax=Elysia chlorotica TaxID=188477 RepID=A0A3S1AB83_ELYCH|nr:hypothetical protein EGW08_004931 [Elysia chlorotica]
MDQKETSTENKGSKKKKEKEANTKRKKELEIIRSELLKKCKLAEEKEIKKPHIVLPREIIPKNIKKEIERQQKEADRRKREFERRVREEEAKASKLEKKKKKAEKRKQTVLNEVTKEDILEKSSSTSSSLITNLSGTSTNSLPTELDSSASSSQKEETEMEHNQDSFLEKHLQAYHQLMKEQPKRHTTQQIEEERKKMQQAEAIKQQDELMRLRKESSRQLSETITNNERNTLLEKLREKEMQRNMEEMDDSTWQIKRSKNSRATQNCLGKTPLTSQRKAARVKGRLQTSLKCPSTSAFITNKFASLEDLSLTEESNNVSKSMTLDTFTWNMSIPNKEFPTFQSFSKKDQVHPLMQIDCNLTQESMQAQDSKMLFQQPFQAPNKSERQTPALSSTWHRAFDQDAPVHSMNSTQSRFSAPMIVSAPVQHSTPCNSKPSRPFSYSECLKRQSYMPIEKANADYHAIPMEETEKSEEMQTEFREDKRFPCSLANKELSVNRKIFAGGPSHEKEMAFKDQGDSIFGRRNIWSWQNKCEAKDTLVPAPTMDDWVRSRKANSSKSLDLNKSSSTQSSFNTTSSSIGEGNPDNVVPQLDRNPSPDFEKDGDRVNTSRPILHSNIEGEDGDQLHSFTPERSNVHQLSEGKKQLMQKSVNSESDFFSRRSEDRLSQMIRQLSVTESQQSQLKTTSQSEVQSTYSSSISALKNENSCQSPMLGLVASNSQDCSSGPNQAPQNATFVQKTTSDMQDKQLPGIIPSFSFPAGVHPSNDVQQLALSLHQQHQQLMLMFLQTQMMMMASTSSKEVENPAQKSITNLGLDSKEISSSTKGFVGCSSRTHRQPSHRKDHVEKVSTQELSDQEIQKVLAKLSDLSCEKKTASRAEKPAYKQKVRGKIDAVTKNKEKIQTNLLVEEEENWVDGIKVDGLNLHHSCKIQPPSATKKRNNVGTKFSEEKMNTILQQIPDLILRPPDLKSQNISASEHCRRPLRKTVTATKCQHIARATKNEVEVANVCDESRDLYCESFQTSSLENKTFPTKALPSKSLSRQSRFKEMINSGVECSKTTEGIDTYHKNFKLEQRKTCSQRKPDNPTRLMTTALGQIKNSNRESGSRSSSPRKVRSASFLKKLDAACSDVDSYHMKHTEQAHGVPKSHREKIQTEAHQEPYRFGGHSLSSFQTLPQASSTEPFKHSSVSKLFEAPMVKSMYETPTADTNMSVYPSGVKSSIGGSKSLRLPTMPSLAASKLMPKLN